jgi:hypothetical protein
MFIAAAGRALSRTPELAVGLLFVSGAVLKARFLRQFVRSIRGYRIVTGERGVWAVAVAVTLGEGLVGTGLFMPWATPFAAEGALALLAIFTTAIVVAMLRPRRPASCGCMVLGRDGAIGWNACVRNVALMALIAPIATPAPRAVSYLSGGALLLLSFALTKGDGRTPTPRAAEV